jgi:hypothetical protein
VKKSGTEVGVDGGSFKCSIVPTTRDMPEGGNEFGRSVEEGGVFEEEVSKVVKTACF